MINLPNSSISRWLKRHGLVKRLRHCDRERSVAGSNSDFFIRLRLFSGLPRRLRLLAMTGCVGLTVIASGAKQSRFFYSLGAVFWIAASAPPPRNDKGVGFTVIASGAKQSRLFYSLAAVFWIAASAPPPRNDRGVGFAVIASGAKQSRFFYSLAAVFWIAASASPPRNDRKRICCITEMVTLRPEHDFRTLPQTFAGA